MIETFNVGVQRPSDKDMLRIQLSETFFPMLDERKEHYMAQDRDGPVVDMGIKKLLNKKMRETMREKRERIA